MDKYSQMIYRELCFLEHYGFETEIVSNGNDISISFYNKNGCFTYHEYLQFGDANIFISSNLADYKQKKYISSIDVGWFVNTVLPKVKKNQPKREFSFVELVKLSLVEQISTKKEIFGIML